MSYDLSIERSSPIPHIFPLIWDSTALMGFDSCNLSGFRKHIQHLSSPEENTHLLFGGAFAKGLEVVRKRFYNDALSQAKAVLEGQKTAIEVYGDHIPHPSNKKTKEALINVIGKYFETYPLDSKSLQPLRLQSGEAAIETSFKMELPFLHPTLKIPLQLVGRVDMLGIWNKRLVNVDEKTTWRLSNPNGVQWATRGQFTTYSALAKKQGIHLDGTLVREVCIGATTSYKGMDLMKSFLPPLQEGEETLSDSSTKVTFQEIFTPRTAWQVDIWEKQAIRKVERYLKYYNLWVEQGFPHPATLFDGNWGESCKEFMTSCEFIDLCCSDAGERYIEGEWAQNIWLPHLQKRVPLEEYLKELEFLLGEKNG